MAERESFGSVQFKMVMTSLVLWIVLVPTSIIGLLYSSWGWMSWEGYIEIMGSSFFQNTYLSEFYGYLANGWLLLLLIVPIVVAFAVASWVEHGQSTSGDKTLLAFQLIAMNIVLMALLAPLTFAGVLSSIGLLPDSALFDFLNSSFVEGLYGHEYSWIWVAFPFLIIGPIVLVACAREWYKSAANVAPATGISELSES